MDSQPVSDSCLFMYSHYQCTKLTILFPISGFIFAAGFAAREYGAFHYRNLNVYLASTMLIYFGPFV